MAYIRLVADDRIQREDHIADRDEILRVHGVHSRIMRLHYELYRELMRGPGPLRHSRREMIAVFVSALNGCVY